MFKFPVIGTNLGLREWNTLQAKLNDGGRPILNDGGTSILTISWEGMPRSKCKWRNSQVYSELGGLAQLRQKQVRIFGLVFSCAKRKKKLSRKFEVT